MQLIFKIVGQSILFSKSILSLNRPVVRDLRSQRGNRQRRPAKYIKIHNIVLSVVRGLWL